MNGPWYTLAETIDKLGITDSELTHQINQGTFTPVVYTKSRWFLLFRLLPEDNKPGATCEYRGHLSMDRAALFRLLDGETVGQEASNIQLLEPTGILAWRTAYPFQHPHRALSDWRPVAQDQAPLSHFEAIPMPSEQQTVPSQLKSLLNRCIDANPEPYKPFIDQPPFDEAKPEPAFHLVFKNSSFSPDDLRVSHSDIERCQDRFVLEQATKPEPAAKGGRERENQLHTLIRRILITEPSLDAKRLWRLIQHESQAEEPRFDSDAILLRVDEDSIEWHSRQGAERELRWQSFGPLVSKLRKQLIDSN